MNDMPVVSWIEARARLMERVREMDSFGVPQLAADIRLAVELADRAFALDCEMLRQRRYVP